MAITATDILGYDNEVTTVNGNDVERFYLDGSNIKFSTILYRGTSPEDANEHLTKYWTAPVKWYISGNRLCCC